ncbi:MAG: hypothetical protein IPJ01_07525 [Micavibrio sp.]|nr:hypothetical protein [Micavibrio sp.]
MTEKVPNSQLLDAGLDLLKQSGKQFAKMANKGRAMLYELDNGETVRVRTCNDHVLIAVADSPEKDANLNIEGTDWLMVVMPETPRTPGDVIAYMIPTNIAVREVRETHQRWLATNPRTKGENTTWNLWFNNDEGLEKAAGYAKKWAQYRLQGKINTQGTSVSPKPNGSANPVKAEVDAARMRIAKVAGVPIEAVRISIDFLS